MTRLTRTGSVATASSCRPGHSSLTQYVQLYLGGFGLELDDLKALRTWGSKTPGHPEYGETDGVEITTGPLGQGLASSVGFAYAARYERGLFDPETPAGESPFDHFVYVIASDGDLQEGVTSEASSLAGHQQLGNLIALYDANQISIEDDTDVAFTEDVAARYEAYGWQVLTVDWKKTGDYVEDVRGAVRGSRGRQSRDRQAVADRAQDGHRMAGADKQNTGGIHGSALGADELAATKQALGFDPEKTFEVSDEVIARTRGLADRAADVRVAWQQKFDAWAAAESRAQGAARPSRGRRTAAGHRGRAAGVRGGQGRCHARCVRQGPQRSRPRHARAVGRFRRSRRFEQHHDRRCRFVQPRFGVDRQVHRTRRTGACCTSAFASMRWARS